MTPPQHDRDAKGVSPTANRRTASGRCCAGPGEWRSPSVDLGGAR